MSAIAEYISPYLWESSAASYKQVKVGWAAENILYYTREPSRAKAPTYLNYFSANPSPYHITALKPIMGQHNINYYK